jgi:hypothetical protein
MFQEFEIRVTGFQRLALLHALSGLLDQAEVQRIHRIRSADPIPVRVPGCLSGVDEELLRRRSRSASAQMANWHRPTRPKVLGPR